MSELTIKDIAQLAGVSHATISRVINNHPSVRPEVRERVWRIINKHHYTPQAAARHLVRQRTHIIGVMLPRSARNFLGNPFFTAIGQGIGRVCVQKGYISVLALGARDSEEEVLCTMLRSRYFDGVVLISNDMNDSLVDLLKEVRLPYTRIGHDANIEDLQSVDVDNTDAAYKAVTHLVALGHRRIAHIAGPAEEVCTRPRYEGYQKALQQAGLPLDPELVCSGDWSPESGQRAMLGFLRLDQPPTAVFSANDMMAAGVLHAAYAQNLTVPDDIAVVGFDDFQQTGMIVPPLTTIRQPGIEMGIRATEMLIDQLEGKDCQPAHIVLPTTLIVRQSCGAMRQPAGYVKKRPPTFVHAISSPGDISTA